MSKSDLIYSIMAYWGPRADTPEGLAPRFLHTLAALSATDPAVFNHWQIGYERGIDLAPLSLAEVIKYIADGREEGVPSSGYSFLALAKVERPRRFALRFHAGCTSRAELLTNSISIETSPLCEGNASLITLAVLKPALLVLASLWQPTWCEIGPWGLNDYMFEPDPPR